MPEVFEALPGLEVPVGEVSGGFAKLWANTGVQDLKAMQLNLVLHLGRAVTPEDARVQFDAAIRFAQRYPCRIVFLCPEFGEGRPPELRAKIYGECFLGKSKSDTRCVEFVLLHYTMAVRPHLENQVSLCLSTDLPLYYWAHRITAAVRLADYHYLLTRSTRILVDSALVPPETFTYRWPRVSALRDLAYTRTLPLRQNLGQFLSRYDPALITAGLQGVTLRHAPGLEAEGHCIVSWIAKGFTRAGLDCSALERRVESLSGPGSFTLEFNYDVPGKSFRWLADLGRNHAEFEGDLGSGRSTLAVGARLLQPEEALAEAMFG
jgi:hypothetical protein